MDQLLCREIPYLAPIDAADRLRHLPGFAFLDSGGDDLVLGRHAFIGVDPFGLFTAGAGQAFWNGDPLPGAPLPALDACLARFRLDPAAGADAPPLRGGCIGHISYDFGRRLERLAPVPAQPPQVAEIRFGFHDLILAFDRAAGRACLYSSGFPETAPAARAHRAARRADWLEGLLGGPQPQPPAAPPPVTGWRSNFTAQGYRAAVAAVQDHIRAGDIYQANLSQRFEAPLPPGFDPWALHHALRRANPAPFAAFIRDGAVAVSSSSPERFLRLQGGWVEARPIKGTSPRDDDPARDAALAAGLVASDKDRAENVMIVDLLRNDLSRVCRPGSVTVPVLCGLESYAGVHHLTSVVRGQMQAGLGAAALIGACFPGGSITGAPKIRAMDIITRIEGVARGLYCGAIGHIGFDGDMDLNIAIRTAVMGAGQAVFQTGGGVTLLSDPDAELAETLTKARRLFAAFGADLPAEMAPDAALSGAGRQRAEEAGPCC